MKKKEAWSYDEVTEGLDVYNDALDGKQRFVSITEIVVPTEHDKQQLLKAFHYIHNLRAINSDFLAVNAIMHLYMTPDKIKVKSNERENCDTK